MVTSKMFLVSVAELQETKNPSPGNFFWPVSGWTEVLAASGIHSETFALETTTAFCGPRAPGLGGARPAIFFS